MTPSLVNALPRRATGAVMSVSEGSKSIDIFLANVLIASAALSAMVEPASASDLSWIAPTRFVLAPTLTIGIVFFLLRVVLSWFPAVKLDEPPWNVVAFPTEPLLEPTRKLVPPVAGVDISPIIWVSLLSFVNEILLGPQGLLAILQKRA